ncbi:MAG TPA: dipicolinate synthase subunit B [Candidatus Caccousia avistercoris]|nr:dipicolinate synthase subunit B [Candidatus Caccousia avistercoris]
MKEITLGFAMCGSFCTFDRALEQMRRLAAAGYRLLPVMSQNACSTDTRFGRAADFVWEAEDICGRKVIHTIAAAEPLGPKRMVDALVIAPCTGNTLGKLANGITDTPVTMAAKSCLRIGLPVVLNIATNDALAASAPNIGRLLNTRNIYFVPFRQDDPEKKPYSLVSDFESLPAAVEEALAGRQLQPVLL